MFITSPLSSLSSSSPLLLLSLHSLLRCLLIGPCCGPFLSLFCVVAAVAAVAACCCLLLLLLLDTADRCCCCVAATAAALLLLLLLLLLLRCCCVAAVPAACCCVAAALLLLLLLRCCCVAAALLLRLRCRCCRVTHPFYAFKLFFNTIVHRLVHLQTDLACVIEDHGSSASQEKTCPVTCPRMCWQRLYSGTWSNKINIHQGFL